MTLSDTIIKSTLLNNKIYKGYKMTRKYTIKGLVQGIGYRPFVAALAEELNITGWVRNTGGIVTVEASGDISALEEFYRKLSTKIPTGGYVTEIKVKNLESPEGHSKEGFQILESDEDTAENLPLIPADIATCDRCIQELFDTNNRRFRHPFISCTICGPRYSIIEKLPYDRDTITMSDFDMCPECAQEYVRKNDRRRHAQTIACPSCGPKLEFISIQDKISDNVTLRGYVDNSVDKHNGSDKKDEIYMAKEVLKHGGIVAIKDIGGYHLACNPFHKKAVEALRILKHRENKAFAVMFENVDNIHEFCIVDNFEQKLLTSPARPIVLVRQNEDTSANRFADNVCLTSPYIGAMLPGNPVQLLLISECGPLIMTSGNASGDVLEIDDAKMESWLKARVESGKIPKDVPIAILRHNRRILRPMDDSVMKVISGRQQFIRRGRGHVPTPIPVDISGEIFATGGDLKSSFCYVKNGLAYVSQHLGDLESVSCQQFYKNEMEAMARIFGFKPKTIATDLHPGYFSRVIGENLAQKHNLPIKHIQHHKAHVAAVIAEHHLKGQVLGFAFDGTGYGEDGSIWGSEAFLWDGKSPLSEMKRVHHLKPVKLIGGDEGAKNCDTILTGMLHATGLDEIDENQNANLITAAIDKDINTVTSTSMGRLFDAVSAMLDICHYNSYEGQAPVELENVAVTADEAYPLCIGEDGDTTSLFKSIKQAMDDNIPVAKIARGFIEAVADYVIGIALKRNIKQVVLSGGTFLNRILTEKVITELEKKDIKVYIAEQLPPGDGGICLGQIFLK